MNDIGIPWKKITRGLPKGRKFADDRAPAIDEIRRIMSIRIEELKQLFVQWHHQELELEHGSIRWKAIRPVTRNEAVIAAKTIAYADEVEAYFSFITPEAYHKVENEWTLAKGLAR